MPFGGIEDVMTELSHDWVKGEIRKEGVRKDNLRGYGRRERGRGRRSDTGRRKVAVLIERKLIVGGGSSYR